MSDRSHTYRELDWTLGRVEVRQFDPGDGQRCVLLNSPDHDMHEHGGEVQAVCLEELDELIEALTEQRDFLSTQPAAALPESRRWSIVVTWESGVSVYGTYADEREAHADAGRVLENYLNEGELPNDVSYEVREIER